jgi:hypothetical protein
MGRPHRRRWVAEVEVGGSPDDQMHHPDLAAREPLGIAEGPGAGKGCR